jgi:hypothetical protein
VKVTDSAGGTVQGGERLVVRHPVGRPHQIGGHVAAKHGARDFGSQRRRKDEVVGALGATQRHDIGIGVRRGQYRTRWKRREDRSGLRQPPGRDLGAGAGDGGGRIRGVADLVSVGHVCCCFQQVGVDDPGDVLFGTGGKQPAEPTRRRQIGGQPVVDEHPLGIAPRDVDQGQQPGDLQRRVGRRRTRSLPGQEDRSLPEQLRTLRPVYSPEHFHGEDVDSGGTQAERFDVHRDGPGRLPAGIDPRGEVGDRRPHDGRRLLDLLAGDDGRDLAASGEPGGQPQLHLHVGVRRRAGVRHRAGQREDLPGEGHGGRHRGHDHLGVRIAWLRDGWRRGKRDR